MSHGGAKTIAIEGLFGGVTQPFNWQFTKVLHELAGRFALQSPS